MLSEEVGGRSRYVRGIWLTGYLMGHNAEQESSISYSYRGSLGDKSQRGSPPPPPTWRGIGGGGCLSFLSWGFRPSWPLRPSLGQEHTVIQSSDDDYLMN